jgi:hypothetical protein
MATACATDGEAAALPLLLPREKEEAPPWRQWAREAGRLGYLALPMVGVTLSQYGVQVSSNMVVGHLPGVLPLSSAAIATSLATVSGFSLLVSLSLSLFFFASVRLLPSISHAVLPCAARVSIGVPASVLGKGRQSRVRNFLAKIRVPCSPLPAVELHLGTMNNCPVLFFPSG